jgi:hypothetical protein
MRHRRSEALHSCRYSCAFVDERSPVASSVGFRPNDRIFSLSGIRERAERVGLRYLIDALQRNYHPRHRQQPEKMTL